MPRESGHFISFPNGIHEIYGVDSVQVITLLLTPNERGGYFREEILHVLDHEHYEQFREEKNRLVRERIMNKVSRHLLSAQRQLIVQGYAIFAYGDNSTKKIYTIVPLEEAQLFQDQRKGYILGEGRKHPNTIIQLGDKDIDLTAERLVKMYEILSTIPGCSFLEIARILYPEKSHKELVSYIDHSMRQDIARLRYIFEKNEYSILVNNKRGSSAQLFLFPQNEIQKLLASGEFRRVGIPAVKKRRKRFQRDI